MGVKKDRMILFGVTIDFIWGKNDLFWDTKDFIWDTKDFIWDTKEFILFKNLDEKIFEGKVAENNFVFTL